jgi:hypothetical protein
LLTGNPYLGATVLGATTGGQSYGQARDDGVGVGRAALKSAIDAAVETGTEIIPEKFLLGDVMAHAGLRKFVWDQVKSEVPFEQAATVLQDFNQWALIDANHGKTFDQYLGEIEPHAWSTLVSTLVGMAPMAGVGATAQLLDKRDRPPRRARRAAAQAEAMREHMQELADLSAASKTRERDAETFHDFVQQATEDTPLEEVYIDPKVLHDTLAQSELEPAQQKIVAERIAPRIAEALEAGTDARVGVADFAAALAGTPAEKVLLDHAKAEPNGMSKVEADEFMAAKGDRLLDEIKAGAGQCGNRRRDQGGCRIGSHRNPRSAAESEPLHGAGQRALCGFARGILFDDGVAARTFGFSTLRTLSGSNTECGYARFERRAGSEGDRPLSPRSKISRVRRASSWKSTTKAPAQSPCSGSPGATRTTAPNPARRA